MEVSNGNCRTCFIILLVSEQSLGEAMVGGNVTTSIPSCNVPLFIRNYVHFIVRE